MPANISSRRSSNDSIIRSGRGSASIPLTKTKSSSQISTLLETALDWNFDIFRLEEITEKRPLVYLGMELCQQFEVFETFKIDEATMKQWLIVIEANYHVGNSYHNSTHAADVMQATAVFLQQLAKKEPNLLDEQDEATALLAAAAHDIDHPGKSSAFLCNSKDKLALLYNDMTVLESHHAAMTFQLTLRDDKVNIFKNLDRDSFKRTRSMIIDMILATEMTRHFEHLAKFVSVFGNETADGKDVGHRVVGWPWSLLELINVCVLFSVSGTECGSRGPREGGESEPRTPNADKVRGREQSVAALLLQCRVGTPYSRRVL